MRIVPHPSGRVKGELNGTTVPGGITLRPFKWERDSPNV